MSQRTSITQDEPVGAAGVARQSPVGLPQVMTVERSLNAKDLKKKKKFLVLLTSF